MFPSLLTDENFAEEVKSGVQAYFVEQYKDVFDLALDYDPAQVSTAKTGTEATL